MQIGWPELLLFAIILLVLFSAASRPAGRALRAFLNELSGRFDESEKSPGSRQSHAQSEKGRNGENPRSGYAQGHTSRQAAAKDPYQVLSIPPDATQEQIRSAYKKLAQMYHPDKVEGLAPEYRQIADRKMKAINAAYEQLKRKADT